jgi:hypothetical protein
MENEKLRFAFLANILATLAVRFFLTAKNAKDEAKFAEF